MFSGGLTAPGPLWRGCAASRDVDTPERPLVPVLPCLDLTPAPPHPDPLPRWGEGNCERKSHFRNATYINFGSNKSVVFGGKTIG